MADNNGEKRDRENILRLVEEYCNKYKLPDEYHSGDRIPYASRVFDSEEMTNLVDASLDFWLTSGKYTEKFEKTFGEYLGSKYVSLVNSGSSANLLAFFALTADELGERAVRRGDEVITVAAGFPTTVAPIIQFGAVPVFIDVSLKTADVDISLLENAISAKTKAVILAHTLGNPFDIKAVTEFCTKHNLWLIEDNCDSLGSEYSLNGKMSKTGIFGDIGTSSFYPPHHMTMGEGGAVYTDNPLLHKIIRSMRDWGRDCVCPPGHDNCCNHRFDAQFGTLPLGYDHKYVYSHFGFNLKATDLQASIGCAQLLKLDDFTKRRRHNFDYLYKGLLSLSDKLYLPQKTEDSEPSWFGFLMVCKENTDRNKTVTYLEKNNIQTRMLFAGNIIRHPCFDSLKEGLDYKVSGELSNTDYIMNNAFWIGVYPGMTDEKLDIMIQKIKEAVK